MHRIAKMQQCHHRSRTKPPCAASRVRPLHVTNVGLLVRAAAVPLLAAAHPLPAPHPVRAGSHGGHGDGCTAGGRARILVRAYPCDQPPRPEHGGVCPGTQPPVVVWRRRVGRFLRRVRSHHPCCRPGRADHRRLGTLPRRQPREGAAFRPAVARRVPRQARGLRIRRAGPRRGARCCRGCLPPAPGGLREAVPVHAAHA